MNGYANQQSASVFVFHNSYNCISSTELDFVLRGDGRKTMHESCLDLAEFATNGCKIVSVYKFNWVMHIYLSEYRSFLLQLLLHDPSETNTCEAALNPADSH